MPSNESDLREIDIQHLLAMYNDLQSEKIRSAHASASLEPDAGLLTSIKAVWDEIERRASEGEGDPELT